MDTNEITQPENFIDMKEGAGNAARLFDNNISVKKNRQCV